jgi:hypothetical protein
MAATKRSTLIDINRKLNDQYFELQFKLDRIFQEVQDIKRENKQVLLRLENLGIYDRFIPNPSRY